MYSKGALEDLIASRLFGAYPHIKLVNKFIPPLKKKIFLSDGELRKMYVKGSKTITIPANAIISPLALDWLDFDGIKIILK